MEIKLYKAIKLKNKLIGEIKNLGRLIENENTIVVGNTRNYDVEDLITKYEDKMNCLVKVKTAIHLANNEIYHKICLLSELKLQASSYKRLACTNGPAPNYTNYRDDDIAEFHSAILMIDKDTRVKEIEIKITNLQDELDEYNYNTIVTIVEVCN